MATIHPIESSSVHKIQAGQVIVDLCSVVKELVENSLDAGATSIDVRFKNHGLESIEVQDNGAGIPKEDYDSIALKHYTSKLRSYEDLTSLQTFGFRGEALSSLCALSEVHIITARDHEAPKGCKLVFETSGKLKSTQVIASQRGTTVAVETIFKNIPVRRQELEKNIKREYGKVLGILQAYACISTDVKLSVSSLMAKGKKTNVFGTKSNKTTRENIANVFGAKTLAALIALDLEFELQPSSGLRNTRPEGGDKKVRVFGHVSRPVVGEGRQTPDRQMFFVNARPCGLPQVAKVINELYKTYNLSQSPFIFANLVLDTNAYDVNVSPDKRTILLHDQGALLESLKTSLAELFEQQQQTVPQSAKYMQRPPPTFKGLANTHQPSTEMGSPEALTAVISATIDDEAESRRSILSSRGESISVGQPQSLIHEFLDRKVQGRARDIQEKAKSLGNGKALSAGKQRMGESLASRLDDEDNIDNIDHHEDSATLLGSDTPMNAADIPLHDFNQRLAEQQAGNKIAEPRIESETPSSTEVAEEAIPAVNQTPVKPKPGVVPNAFERMRSMRALTQTAIITVGSTTRISEIGAQAPQLRTYRPRSRLQIIGKPPKPSASQLFSSSMRAFAASGTRRTESPSQKSEEDAESEEDVDRSDSESSDCEVTTAKRAVSTGSFQSHASEKGNSNNPEDSVDDSLEQQSLADSDDPAAEYVDDETRKAREDAKVARLITEAEERATRPSQDNMKRAQQLLAGQKNKDSSTTTLMQQIDTTTETIADQLSKLHQALEIPPLQSFSAESIPAEENVAAEERLSLSVSKDDFKKMNIIGQFNLGFIIADRPGHMRGDGVISPFSSTDELFIIDQHASDEKYNFERLQATTIVQNQRLVQPKMLELTAIEEEIILENQNALLMNGFVIEVDESGDLPVGQRCQLISLPMSKEVTFSPRDLEELIVLLSEALPSSMDTGSDSSKFHNNVPRPSKVRKMFAMRACRSSVMIGKTLTKGQMQKLVQNMGEINQPWNCPHGRPTMRHLLSLGSWEGWQEGEGVVGLEEGGATTGEVAWNDWLDGLAESELEADSGSLEGDIEREDSEEGYSGLAGEVQERMVTDE